MTEHKTITHEAKNGTITFDQRVMNQDVYATVMTRGRFKELTGWSPEGSDDDAGYAFLIREQTELRWSRVATGVLIGIE